MCIGFSSSTVTNGKGWDFSEDQNIINVFATLGGTRDPTPISLMISWGLYQVLAIHNTRVWGLCKWKQRAQKRRAQNSGVYVSENGINKENKTTSINGN